MSNDTARVPGDRDKLADAFVECVRSINSRQPRKHGQSWNWGYYCEELSSACGIAMKKPDVGEAKDGNNKTRKAFTRTLREVLPEEAYSFSEVVARRHQLVDAIIKFSTQQNTETSPRKTLTLDGSAIAKSVIPQVHRMQ